MQADHHLDQIPLMTALSLDPLLRSVVVKIKMKVQKVR
jgi:hypothetical protein